MFLDNILAPPEIKKKKILNLLICKGISITVLKNHTNCSFLSIDSDTCNACKKYCKNVAETDRRKKRKINKRISYGTNVVDKIKGLPH